MRAINCGSSDPAVGDLQLNLKQMQSAKSSSVSKLTGGIETLFKMNKVDYIKGTASFQSATKLDVALLDGGNSEVEAKNIIIATGSEISKFPGIDIDEKQVVSSTGALELDAVPGKFLVIGGGIIGLEMGSVWSRLGSEVTVVEYLGAIGGNGMDTEVAKQFQKILGKQGLKFKLQTKVLGLEKRDGKCFVKVEAAKGGKQEELEADVVLVAIGRKPVTEGLNLEKVGIEVDEKGRVVVDSQFNTSVGNVKCIGDVTFGPMLAHKVRARIATLADSAGRGGGHRGCRVPEGRSRACRASVISVARADVAELRHHPQRRLHAPGSCVGRTDER